MTPHTGENFVMDNSFISMLSTQASLVKWLISISKCLRSIIKFTWLNLPSVPTTMGWCSFQSMWMWPRGQSMEVILMVSHHITPSINLCWFTKMSMRNQNFLM